MRTEEGGSVQAGILAVMLPASIPATRDVIMGSQETDTGSDVIIAASSDHGSWEQNRTSYMWPYPHRAIPPRGPIPLWVQDHRAIGP